VPKELAVALGHKVCSLVDKHISCEDITDNRQQTMSFYGPLSCASALLLFTPFKNTLVSLSRSVLKSLNLICHQS